MSLSLSFARVIKFTFQNIFRNFWLSFITLTIFVLTLVTVNLVLFINVAADSALQAVEQKVEMTFYFEPETSTEIVTSAQGYLRGFSQVSDVEYISAEESLESFRARHLGDEVILSSLDEVDGNPFGDSLVVTTQSSSDFAFIVEAMETPEFAGYIKDQDFTDYEEVIEKIQVLKTRIGYAGLAVACVFILIAIMIIFNTIRVAIYVHREEISIMKLVGANNWFVRGPFILEALLYSAVATGLMIAILFGFLSASSEQIVNYFGGAGEMIFDYFSQNIWIIFGSQFMALAALSLLTTAFAMRKYLKA